MNPLVKALTFLFILFPFADQDLVNDSSHLEVKDEFRSDLSYNEILRSIGPEKLLRGTERPGKNGSLGRNKQAYFHVRFQMNMTSISDYAIAAESLEALEYLLATIEYAFAHQRNDGSFKLAIPKEIRDLKSYHAPMEGDLASGISFFCSSLV